MEGIKFSKKKVYNEKLGQKMIYFEISRLMPTLIFKKKSQNFRFDVQSLFLRGNCGFGLTLQVMHLNLQLCEVACTPISDLNDSFTFSFLIFVNRKRFFSLRQISNSSE